MHPRVKEAYQQAGFEPLQSADDAIEETFFRKFEDPVKLNQKNYSGPRVVSKHLDQVFRVVKPKVSDYVVYRITKTGVDSAGNETTRGDIIIGKYELPKFNYVNDQLTGDVRSVSIQRKETVYEIPYTKQVMQELFTSGEYVVDDNTKLYLDISGRNVYAGFSIDEFTNLTGDELVRIIQEGRDSEEEGAAVAGRAAAAAAPAAAAPTAATATGVRKTTPTTPTAAATPRVRPSPPTKRKITTAGRGEKVSTPTPTPTPTAATTKVKTTGETAKEKVKEKVSVILQEDEVKKAWDDAAREDESLGASEE